jgi:hypothetical protein
MNLRLAVRATNTGYPVLSRNLAYLVQNQFLIHRAVFVTRYSSIHSKQYFCYTGIDNTTSYWVASPCQFDDKEKGTPCTKLSKFAVKLCIRTTILELEVALKNCSMFIRKYALWVLFESACTLRPPINKHSIHGVIPLLHVTRAGYVTRSFQRCTGCPKSRFTGTLPTSQRNTPSFLYLFTQLLLLLLLWHLI